MAMKVQGGKLVNSFGGVDIHATTQLRQEIIRALEKARMIDRAMRGSPGSSTKRMVQGLEQAHKAVNDFITGEP